MRPLRSPAAAFFVSDNRLTRRLYDARSNSVLPKIDVPYTGEIFAHANRVPYTTYTPTLLIPWYCAFRGKIAMRQFDGIQRRGHNETHQPLALTTLSPRDATATASADDSLAGVDIDTPARTANGPTGLSTAAPVTWTQVLRRSGGLRRRIIRSALGLSLLAAAGALYLPSMLFATSSEAILNARIVTLAAPIEGRIVNAPPPEGTVVRTNEPLLTIENPTVDRGRVQDLEATRSRTQAELVGARRLTAALTAQMNSLETQIAAYQAATVSRLELTRREREAETVAARAAASEARTDLQRKRSLGAKEIVSAAALDKAEQTAIQTQAGAERADLAAQRIAQELDAAKHGVYVTDDHNNVPYSQQRTDEILVRLAEARSQEAMLATRLTELDKQVNEEKARAEYLARAEVTAPTAGVVWRPLVTTGSAVARETELMTLIDCTNLYATAVFSGKQFDDLRPGRHATIRPLSASARYTGTVVDVRAMQRSDAEERFAAPLPVLAGNQILAIIRLDDPRDLTSQKYCNVGRRIEVRFAGAGAEGTAPSEPSHVR